MSSPRALGFLQSAHAVCLDMDGTLIDSETVAASIVAENLARHGVVMTDRECAAAFTGHPDSHIRVHVLERSGRTLPDDFEATLQADLGRRMHVGALPMPGALALVASIPASVAVAVVSNSRPDVVVRALSGAGLDALLARAVISGYDRGGTARPKPAPDLYLQALRRMGYDATEAVAVEDSAPGVTAALAAGLRVVAVGEGHRHIDTDDVATCPSLLIARTRS